MMAGHRVGWRHVRAGRRWPPAGAARRGAAPAPAPAALTLLLLLARRHGARRDGLVRLARLRLALARRVVQLRSRLHHIADYLYTFNTETLALAYLIALH